MQPALIQLLIAADGVDAANRLISSLRAANLGVRSAHVGNEHELASQLAQAQWDVVVCYAGARLAPAAVLAALRRNELDLPLICVAADTDIAPPRADLREAIAPADHERLLLAVRREAEISQLRRQVRQLELQQRELEKRQALLFSSSATPIAYVQDGIHLACNPAYARCFGYDSSASAIERVPLLDLLSPDERPRARALLSEQVQGETRATLRIRRMNSSEEAMELCLMPVQYHGKTCLQLSIAAAPGNADYAATVAGIGQQDLLTSLDNAAHFLTRIEHAIRAAVQDNRTSSLLLVDINGFDDIRRAIGRSSANIVLNDIAHFLQDLLSEGDFAARLDEHQFGLLLGNGNPDQAIALARAIQGTLNSHISSAMLPALELSCAIGMALINAAAGAADNVLERARANLKDKPLNADGKFQYRVGEDLRHDAGVMLDYLRSALINRRFKLLFQPLVAINGAGYKSYEVLSRMLDRDGNEVSPAAFLPLANLNGVGEEIDRLVVGLALDSMREADTTERLIINVTSNTLMSRTFLPWLSDRMRAGRVASDVLVLQISEVDIHGNPAQALQFCRGLRQLNAGMAVSHFGCALEPFAILDALQPAFVKLDETLVRDIIYSAQQRQAIQDQIRQLHARRLLVIAPQVEDMDVLPVLWQAGADYVQGYCLQRPSDEMNYEFVHVEEITLSAPQN
jgi:diguanylate cyclase (GGDEF)-like protein